MRSLVVIAVVLAALGCAASPSAPPASPDPQVTIAPADLNGYWAEYWAPGGHLRTQRHLFLPDGRWGWACEGGCPAPERRTGRWALEGTLLRIEANDGAQALAIDACPPNEEAYAMDAQYKCLAFGGRVFWWQDGADAGDPEAFVAPAAP